MRKIRYSGAALVVTLGLATLGAGGAAAPAGAASASISQSPQNLNDRRVDQVDRNYLVAAHDSNLNEIYAGKIALKRSTNPTIRAIAQQLVTEHYANDVLVKRAAKKARVKLGVVPSAGTELELTLLSQPTAAAFDGAWLAQQIVAHVRGIVFTKLELRIGESGSTLRYAMFSLPVLQKHYAALYAASVPFGIPSMTLKDLGGILDNPAPPTPLAPKPETTR